MKEILIGFILPTLTAYISYRASIHKNKTEMEKEIEKHKAEIDKIKIEIDK
jgi:uncharacterized membrane-anchored protein YhcB (DUF1043 family)